MTVQDIKDLDILSEVNELTNGDGMDMTLCNKSDGRFHYSVIRISNVYVVSVDIDGVRAFEMDLKTPKACAGVIEVVLTEWIEITQ